MEGLIMKEYYSFGVENGTLKQFFTSDDGKTEEMNEYIEMHRYNDLSKQLEYANKKIENRDVMISEIQNDRDYWRQRAEVLEELHEEDQKSDKTEGLKGTIRGLEKTRDRLQSEVNSLIKRLHKSESRADSYKDMIVEIKADMMYWYERALKAEEKNNEPETKS
jgi:predicted  nucleic acid-binding Zn-ribbon protein